MTTAETESGSGLSVALTMDPQAQVVVGTSGVILVRTGAGSISVKGVPPAAIREVIGSVDAGRSLDEISRSLRTRYPPEWVGTVLTGLSGLGVFHPSSRRREGDRPAAEVGAPDGSLPDRPVAVIGNGALFTQVKAALGRAGFRAVRCIRAQSFASCMDPDFIEEQRNRVLTSPVAPAPSGPAGDLREDEVLRDVTVDALCSIMAEAEVAVCALEWSPYRATLDMNEAAFRSGTSVIPITVDGTAALLGPTVVPGRTACLQCLGLTTLFGQEADRWAAEGALPFLACGGLSGAEADRLLGDLVCGELVREVEDVLADPPRPGLLAEVVRLTPDGHRSVAPILPLASCPRCDPSARAADGARTQPKGLKGQVQGTALARRAAVEVGLALDARAATAPGRGREPGSDGYHSVGILGGGTAGYLAALTFRARFPEMPVTLIESSKVPVIGVGEATTPRLVEYLHSPADLGRDIIDFHRRVLPVWKLGVLYYWGLPGDYAFPWPFQYGSLLEPHLYEGNIGRHCLGALLMSSKRVPVVNGNGSPVSLLHRIPFAYHLDNQRFVRYLAEEAERAGVTRLDRVVTDAELSPDGQEVTALLTENGERLSFDLYVDCSGFRSLLLEQKLGSRFVSYADSLFTDAAVVANVPHDGTVKPYTLAESMDNGWCWNIAFDDQDHRGYVFSSAFCTLDEAEAEMRAKNPGMSDAWTLRFRSGRHEHMWKGNVVALGNAYAFVEPLASTAIHMLLYELDLVTRNFPSSRRDRALKEALSAHANRMWDDLRGWLAVQYRFNRKFETPFWQACRSDVDLAGAAERVALFRERAPLSSSNSLTRRGSDSFFLPQYGNDYFAQEYVYDVMLLGQHVPGRFVQPSESEREWRRRIGQLDEIVDWALPQREAMELTRDRPEILVDMVRREDSWLGEHLY